MSSILKALKKLEAEQSRLQEEKQLNVAAEILRPPTARGIQARWLWLLGSTSIGVIIILTFALLRKPSPKEAPQAREIPLISQPASAPATTPALTGLDTKPQTNSNKGAGSNIPSSPETRNMEPQQQQVNPLREDFNNKTTLELPSPPGTTMEPPRVEPAAKSTPRPPPLTTGSTLTLSGIAWNKDSADRLAIINGQPTAIGATLNGAVVEEILQDRVKLSLNGHTIELLIGKSTKTD